MTCVHPSTSSEPSWQDAQQHLFPPSWSEHRLLDHQCSHNTKWDINRPNFTKVVMAFTSSRRTSGYWSWSNSVRRTTTPISTILQRKSSTTLSALAVKMTWEPTKFHQGGDGNDRWPSFVPTFGRWFFVRYLNLKPGKKASKKISLRTEILCWIISPRTVQKMI